MQHKTVKETPKYTLCYLGAVPRFSRDDLLEICQNIVDELGLAPIDGRIYEAHEFDQFIKGLRGFEVAIVPILSGLAFKKGSGVTIQFFINERRVVDKATYLVSLDTTKPRAIADTVTASSDKRLPWDRLLGAVAEKVARGRVLKTPKAKEMNRKKHAKHGLVQTWELKLGTAEYLNHAYIWGNLGITPAKTAIGLFPDDDLRKASPKSVERIFGTRSECATWLKQLNNK